MIGCKRILLSNDFYPALQHPHVQVLSQPIAAIQHSMGEKEEEEEEEEPISSIQHSLGRKEEEEGEEEEEEGGGGRGRGGGGLIVLEDGSSYEVDVLIYATGPSHPPTHPPTYFLYKKCII